MDTTQAAKFLDALHQPVPRSREGRLLVQLKAIPASREGRPYVRSYPLSALTNGFGFAETCNAAGFNIFVSVNPRFRWGGKKVDVDGVVALPFDYDDMELALAAADHFHRLGLVPGLAVRSGRGGHIYLLLDRYETRVEEAQAIGRRLCRFTGSDAVHARSQVMRLPGSVNPKREAAGAVAQLTWCDPTCRYSLEAIVARLDAAGVPVPAVRPRRSPSLFPAAPRARALISAMPSVRVHGDVALCFDDLTDEEAERQDQLRTFLPERYQRIADEGVPRGERSGAVFGLVRVLTNVGADEDEIDTFIRLRPSGIGEVVVEKGAGWLDYTVAKVLGDAAPAPSEPTALSTVRLLGVQPVMFGDRMRLFLVVEDGPLKGAGVKGGIDLVNPRARDPWRFLFMAFGKHPPPFGDAAALQGLIGLHSRVLLERDGVGWQVKRWCPVGH